MCRRALGRGDAASIRDGEGPIDELACRTELAARRRGRCGPAEQREGAMAKVGSRRWIELLRKVEGALSVVRDDLRVFRRAFAGCTLRSEERRVGKACEC